jgi:cold shock CspA family protein
MPQGTVKDFDVEARTGWLLLDDRTEIKIDPVSIQGSEVRYLRIGQRVRFDLDEVAGERVARRLHVVTF